MKIFVSYSGKDREIVDLIKIRLQKDGHEICNADNLSMTDDEVAQVVDRGLESAEAFIVVISENSSKSDWVQFEFTAIALKDISQSQKRVIPIRIDKTPVPSYFTNVVYLDLSSNFELGLESLSRALASKSLSESLSDSKSMGVSHVSHDTNIRKLSQVLRKGRLTLMCGAGVSVGAGMPAWNTLLARLLESMMNRISQNYSLEIGRKTADEFHKRYESSSLILGKYLKNNLGKDFASEIRDALYSTNPSSCELIDSIVNLARPQRNGSPLDSIITFNFDALIEENLSTNSIRNKAIYSEAIEHDPSELPIYHVHGFLPRSGDIPAGNDLVFSEDAYHSQFIESFSWSNLVQLNKLTQNTCFLIGISLTDPNMRRLLDVAWRKNPSKSPAHFIAKKLPTSGGGDITDQVCKLLEEQDANALGLNVVWMEDFNELPKILDRISTDHRH